MEDLLVIERTGTCWGVARLLVRAFERGERGLRITLDTGCLHADRVVGMVRGAEVRLPGRVLRRYWPVVSRGLTVHEGRIVVVIDPAAPPGPLSCRSEGAPHDG
jgi:hypothetical protein